MGIRNRFGALFQAKPAFISDIRWQRVLLAAVLYVIILTTLYLAIAPTRVDVEQGRPSPRTIKAERDAIDYFTTEQLRDQAALAVPEAYDYDPAVLLRAEERVDNFFAAVKEVRKEQELEEQEKISRLLLATGLELNETLAAALLSARASDLNEMRDQLKEILGMILRQGVKAEAIETARRQIIQEINFLILAQDHKRMVDKLAQAVIEPNMIYNPVSTAQAREAARQGVEPVRIMKDEVIIWAGDPVTDRHIKQLEALGLIRSKTDYTMFLGLSLLLLVIFTVVGFYLYIFQQEVYRDIKKLLLLGLIALITLVLSIAATYFSGYLVPLAMGTMLITVLINPRLAILMGVVMALFTALVTGNDFRFLLVALLGGMVAIYSVSHLERRSDLTRAGLYVSALNAVTIFGLFLFTGALRLQYELLREFSASVLAGITSGLFSAVMTIGLLPYLESAFGLTTSVTLLELANPNNPLLKKLLMEAPGTYHHSLVVANLAEAAAEGVGADPLLTRVGSFYHDIGKLRRPYFFIENQLGENPHEKLSPNLSTLIITSHIRDGVEMAKKARLPKVISDIICQHHGNGLVSYFYHQAAEQEKLNKNSVCEENFRYEAPLPQSKEAAIILLADSVEAAARSMPKPVGGRIEGVVRKIIRERLIDGQFDQCNLTLKDLDIIAGTFVRILSGVYHNRIEYPEKELKAEFERGSKNGPGCQQSAG